jgi:FixJ family two-component response regulator
MSPTVFVVDDESTVRQTMVQALASMGWRTKGYQSASAFLSDYRGEPGCLVLDAGLDARKRPAVRARLAEAKYQLPVVFVARNGSIEMGVAAMKAGAVDFLTKPCDEVRLLAAVCEAVEQDRTDRLRRDELRGMRGRYAQLTPREREVCELVVTGLLNKQIAHELGVVEKTVKVHRARAMRKMGVESLAELVHCMERMGLGLATKQSVTT